MPSVARIRQDRGPIIVLAALGLATMVCALPLSGDNDEEDLPATIEALQAELESVRASGFPGQGARPDQQQGNQPAQPRGGPSGALIEDTFELDLASPKAERVSASALGIVNALLPSVTDQKSAPGRG